MARRPLPMRTLLAPNMFGVYQFIARYVGDKLGIPTELAVGSGYHRMTSEADVAFICGLPYVQLRKRHHRAIEPLAAPVLRGPRYNGRPVYYSDVVVRRTSPFRTFADLRGRSWAYNEPHSHSGYGVTRYRLIQLGQTNGFFSRVVEAGWHERSIRMVCSGEVDASAIDSQVLAVALRDYPELAMCLRVIDTFGPSSIQPVVAGPALSDRLKADVQAVLVEMGQDPEAQHHLAHGFVERFVPVDDSTYDDVRDMLAAAEAADF